MGLQPVERVRKLAPGTWTNDDTDETWRVIGDALQPTFSTPAVGTAWANYLGPPPGFQVPPSPKLQFRIQWGRVYVVGVLAKADQPLGDFGSEVFLMPAGYLPAEQFVSEDDNWAVWEATAPAAPAGPGPGSVVWQGRSNPGIGIVRAVVNFSYLADG